MSRPPTMRAWRLDAPGPPEALTLTSLPVPEPRGGQVLIRIDAFGINRAEMFTRRGDSPSVKLPRVIGIECTGHVEAAPETDLAAGTRVVAIMGGMGREYDGSYAEYVCVPRAHVFAVESSLDAPTLGALPEMFQTVHGSLTVGLEAGEGDALLVRGGTSSIGLTTILLAKARGMRVLATTRSESKRQALLDAGADDIVIDDGVIADKVRALAPRGVDRVLELVGTATLKDSLRCARPGGVVCMTGILGDSWTMTDFAPMDDIPTGVRLTSYSGGSGDLDVTAFRDFVDRVELGEIAVKIARVFEFDDVVDAHRHMEESRGAGKLVVRVR
jgi:NADPH:quinone reductase